MDSEITHTTPHTITQQLMSGYTNFAVAGAGAIGSFIVEQLLKDKAAGTVKEVIVLTRQVKYPYDNQQGYTWYAE